MVYDEWCIDVDEQFLNVRNTEVSYTKLPLAKFFVSCYGITFKFVQQPISREYIWRSLDDPRDAQAMSHVDSAIYIYIYIHTYIYIYICVCVCGCMYIYI